MQMRSMAAAKPWRWAFYALVPACFVLGSIMSFELVMVGAFTGWGDRNAAKSFYFLTVIVPWFVTIVLGVRAIGAARAGNVRSAVLQTTGMLVSALIGLGIIETGIFV